MLKYARFGVIFTGDATGATERAAIANFEGDPRATVLTASHYVGSSKGSNSRHWAAATEPAVVIYSAGTLFGQPRCAARDILDEILATTPEHNAICGNSGTDYREFTTRRAEYMT